MPGRLRENSGQRAARPWVYPWFPMCRPERESPHVFTKWTSAREPRGVFRLGPQLRAAQHRPGQTARGPRRPPSTGIVRIHQQTGARVAQYVPGFLGDQPRVQRQEHRTQLAHREEQAGELRAVCEQGRNHVPGLHAQSRQIIGHGLGIGLKLRVGESRCPPLQGNAVRGA